MAQKNSQTHKFEIKNFKEIYDYCYLNGIIDINYFIEKCLKQGFDIEKYGLLGKDGQIEKTVEKEIVVEKIVEVVKEVPSPPVEVEVIKYVDREVIKEVPVEKVVSKIEYIYDKKPSELEEKISNLEKELEDERRNFSTKTIEMEKIFQNEMSKRDKNLDEIRRSLDINLDENKTKMLTDTLTKLRKEISEKNQLIEELKNKIKELETIKINQGAVFMKGSNLTQNL